MLGVPLDMLLGLRDTNDDDFVENRFIKTEYGNNLQGGDERVFSTQLKRFGRLANSLRETLFGQYQVPFIVGRCGPAYFD